MFFCNRHEAPVAIRDRQPNKHNYNVLREISEAISNSSAMGQEYDDDDLVTFAIKTHEVL